MSPKLITLHVFRHSPLEDACDEIMVNPRRVDCFRPERPPTQYPTLYCGTRVCLGSKSYLVVRETIADIKRLLK